MLSRLRVRYINLSTPRLSSSISSRHFLFFQKKTAHQALMSLPTRATFQKSWCQPGMLFSQPTYVVLHSRADWKTQCRDACSPTQQRVRCLGINNLDVFPASYFYNITEDCIKMKKAFPWSNDLRAFPATQSRHGTLLCVFVSFFRKNFLQ